MVFKYIVDSEYEGRTVKQILKNKLGFSERLVKRLKYSGNILCNSVPVHINVPVKIGDIVSAVLDFAEENENIEPENIKLDIIYEDDCLIAVNKQADMVVHPTSTHRSGTVANALVYYFQCQDVKKKIRPVSRLDRDTSGIILFAKNEFIQEHLILQMKEKTFIKEYIGIVNGLVENSIGTIDLPIERKPGSIMLRHVSKSGSPSITHYSVISYLNNATLLRFNLETGRTHQIRVHCQAIGYPLIGDTLYSDINTEFIQRQALHSHKVIFTHPINNHSVELAAPIPADISKLLEILRK